jgi:transposase
MNPPVVEARRGIEPKVNVLELARQLGNVSKACKMVGYSRDSFYRFKKRFEAGGEAALEDISRRKPLLKNRVASEIEMAIVELALQHPRYGQVRVAAELKKRELSVSAAGVRCVWLRHGLQTTERRLQAIAARASSPVAAE